MGKAIRFYSRGIVLVAALASVLSAAASAATPSAPQGAKKYHPGHYVALMLRPAASSQSIMYNTLKPGVSGFLKRYFWKDLEPQPGKYDFSEIESDLSWATVHGVRLIVAIEDKTFFKPVRPTPAYLDEYTRPNKKGGYTVVRWSPYVIQRQKELLRALGTRFDNSAALEGIVPQQESAPGFDDATLNATGYTPEKYRDVLIEVLVDAAISFPKTRVFWFMNFFPGKQAYIGSVAQAVAPYGVVMGGPDILPEDDSLVRHAYPMYTDFAGRMPLFGYISPPSYRQHHPGNKQLWTPAELLKYSCEELHVNYMFWMRFPRLRNSPSYGWTDALPVIDNQPLPLL